MKYAFIFFILSIALTGLGWYMLTQVVNPLDETKIEQLAELKGITKPEELYALIGNLVQQGVIREYIVVRRIVPVLGIVILAIVAMFIAIHTFLDKLFFKEFYRNANLRLALRRGVLLGMALTAVVIFRFLGIELFASLSPLLLALIIEILIMSILRARKQNRLHRQAELEHDFIEDNEPDDPEE